jgi:hypothetical protein
MMERLGMENF